VAQASWVFLTAERELTVIYFLDAMERLESAVIIFLTNQPKADFWMHCYILL